MLSETADQDHKSCSQSMHGCTQNRSQRREWTSICTQNQSLAPHQDAHGTKELEHNWNVNTEPFQRARGRRSQGIYSPGALSTAHWQAVALLYRRPQLPLVSPPILQSFQVLDTTPSPCSFRSRKVSALHQSLVPYHLFLVSFTFCQLPL